MNVKFSGYLLKLDDGSVAFFPFSSFIYKIVIASDDVIQINYQEDPNSKGDVFIIDIPEDLTLSFQTYSITNVQELKASDLVENDINAKEASETRTEFDEGASYKILTEVRECVGTPLGKKCTPYVRKKLDIHLSKTRAESILSGIGTAAAALAIYFPPDAPLIALATAMVGAGYLILKNDDGSLDLQITRVAVLGGSAIQVPILIDVVTANALLEAG